MYKKQSNRFAQNSVHTRQLRPELHESFMYLRHITKHARSIENIETKELNILNINIKTVLAILELVSKRNGQTVRLCLRPTFLHVCAAANRNV